jgi:RNA polymerase sigma-70 factor (ECF subfamily)
MLDDWITQSLDRLYRYALALTRDADQARDLVQDCVVLALSARNRPDTAPATRSWACRILRNRWIDILRARRREDELLDHGTDEAMGAPVKLRSHLVDALAVREAFAQLPLAHRDILALIDICGLSYDEAATALAIPRGTVMSRVCRARRALAQMLDDERRVIPFPATRDRP